MASPSFREPQKLEASLPRFLSHMNTGNVLCEAVLHGNDEKFIQLLRKFELKPLFQSRLWRRVEPEHAFWSAAKLAAHYGNLPCFHAILELLEKRFGQGFELPRSGKESAKAEEVHLQGFLNRQLIELLCSAAGCSGSTEPLELLLARPRFQELLAGLPDKLFGDSLPASSGELPSRAEAGDPGKRLRMPLLPLAYALAFRADACAELLLERAAVLGIRKFEELKEYAELAIAFGCSEAMLERCLEPLSPLVPHHHETDEVAACWIYALQFGHRAALHQLFGRFRERLSMYHADVHNTRELALLAASDANLELLRSASEGADDFFRNRRADLAKAAFEFGAVKIVTYIAEGFEVPEILELAVQHHNFELFRSSLEKLRPGEGKKPKPRKGGLERRDAFSEEEFLFALLSAACKSAEPGFLRLLLEVPSCRFFITGKDAPSQGFLKRIFGFGKAKNKDQEKAGGKGNGKDTSGDEERKHAKGGGEPGKGRKKGRPVCAAPWALVKGALMHGSAENLRLLAEELEIHFEPGVHPVFWLLRAPDCPPLFCQEEALSPSARACFPEKLALLEQIFGDRAWLEQRLDDAELERLRAFAGPGERFRSVPSFPEEHVERPTMLHLSLAQNCLFEADALLNFGADPRSTYRSFRFSSTALPEPRASLGPLRTRRWYLGSRLALSSLGLSSLPGIKLLLRDHAEGLSLDAGDNGFGQGARELRFFGAAGCDLDAWSRVLPTLSVVSAALEVRELAHLAGLEGKENVEDLARVLVSDAELEVVAAELEMKRFDSARSAIFPFVQRLGLSSRACLTKKTISQKEEAELLEEEEKSDLLEELSFGSGDRLQAGILIRLASAKLESRAGSLSWAAEVWPELRPLLQQGLKG